MKKGKKMMEKEENEARKRMKGRKENDDRKKVASWRNKTFEVEGSKLKNHQSC